MQTIDVSQGSRLLTVSEVARILNVGRTKVWELVYSGRLRSFKLDGCRRVRRSAVDEFIAEQEAAADPGR